MLNDLEIKEQVNSSELQIFILTDILCFFQTAGGSHNIKVSNKSFEYVSKSKCSRTAVTKITFTN